EAWPANVVDVSQLPGNSDDERFAKAIATCKKEGGVIFAPAGTFRLTQSLVLPHKTILRGAGMDKTKLEWSVDPKDNNGNHLPLLCGAPLSGKDSLDRYASFSLENLSLIASPTYEGNLIERMDASVPAHFRKVSAVLPLQTMASKGYVLYLCHTRNLEITGCDWSAFNVIRCNYTVGRGTSHIRITDNRFRWRGGYLWLMCD